MIWFVFNPFPNKPWFLRVCSTGLLKTLRKEEIASNKQFLLFPECFLPIWRTFCHFHQILNCRLQSLSVWKSLEFIVWERINPFPHNAAFWRPWETSLLKTLWEKDKFACNEQFLLFPQCFLPVRITLFHFSEIWNCRLQTLSVWKSLKFCYLVMG